MGAKSPKEALDMLKDGSVSAGAKVGIYNQLKLYPDEGKLATDFVIAYPRLFNEKLRRLAADWKSGKTARLEALENKSGLSNLLWRFGVKSKVRITIREDRAFSVRRFLYPTNLEIAQDVKANLQCVAMSGYWSSVPRTFEGILTISVASEAFDMAAAFFGNVEDIELISTLEERIDPVQAISEDVLEILKQNPDLFFDRALFVQTCLDRGFSREVDRVKNLSNEATMEATLLLFYGNLSRMEFLEYYIGRFNEALSPAGA